MKGYGIVIAGLVLTSLSGAAQPVVLIRAKPVRTDAYVQKIDYYGPRQRRFVLTTFLKDSTLYRIDNYELMSQLQVHGPSPDTMNVSLRQGPTRIFYPGGKPYLSCSYKQGALNGPLLLFYHDGSLKRRELYRLGLMKRSDCYTPEGERCPCAPLFQAPQWNGDPQNLQAYLADHLQPLMEKESLSDLHLIFWISALGQVSQVDVTSDSGPSESTLYATAKTIAESMPNWLPNQFNWKPALMDGVALPEQQHVYINRRQGGVSVTIGAATQRLSR